MPQLAAVVRQFAGDQSRYHPCLLLVDEQVDRLTNAAASLAAEQGWPALDVGRELSKTLLDVAEARRAGSVWQLCDRLIAYPPDSIGILTGISLLFEPSLHLDPLRVVLQACRRRRLLVCWPGSLVHGALAYASREHAHYRTWPASAVQDCLIHAIQR